MTIEEMQKRFPCYFKNFNYNIPPAAIEQEFVVYRACKTRNIEKASFLNTYEENGKNVISGCSLEDPQQYCLSTYTKLKDIKRFVVVTGKYNPPFALAKGITSPTCGLSCKTSDWKATKNSHVDWWLYSNAEPWKHFELVDYEKEVST